MSEKFKYNVFSVYILNCFYFFFYIEKKLKEKEKTQLHFIENGISLFIYVNEHSILVQIFCSRL